MRTFLQNKTAGWYIFGVSVVLAIIAVIAYVARGGDIFTRVDPIAVICSVVGIVLSLVLMWKDVKPLEIVPFVLYFVTFLIFAGSEIEFIGNVVYGTDGQAIDPAFIVTAACGFLSVICGMVACIMKLEKERTANCSPPPASGRR